MRQCSCRRKERGGRRAERPRQSCARPAVARGADGRLGPARCPPDVLPRPHCKPAAAAQPPARSLGRRRSPFQSGLPGGSLGDTPSEGHLGPAAAHVKPPRPAFPTPPRPRGCQGCLGPPRGPAQPPSARGFVPGALLPFHPLHPNRSGGSKVLQSMAEPRCGTDGETEAGTARRLLRVTQWESRGARIQTQVP